MTRLYAVVRPAAYKANSFFDAITSIVIQPYYYLQFESVSGFTLGHQPIFYDSLDDAKSNFHPILATGHTFFPDRAQQNAIIEMAVDNSTIVGFTVLHTVSSIYKELIPEYLDGDEEILVNVKKTVVAWRETDIEPRDISTGALDFINHCYQKQRSDNKLASAASL